jgi:hypothetical protein
MEKLTKLYLTIFVWLGQYKVNLKIVKNITKITQSW